MLQSMRERMQGVITFAIVAVISVTFVLFGIQYYFHGTGAENKAAKVNGTYITKDELHSSYDRLKRQMMSQNGAGFNIDQDAQKDLNQKLLQGLIKNRVLSQSAKKFGMYISNRQLLSIIKQLPIFQDQGQFSNAKFQEILSNLSYSQDSFFEQTREALLVSQFENSIVNSAFVLPYELENAIKLLNQKRDIAYFVIPQNKFLKQVNIKRTDVEGYYEQHKNDFMTDESVAIEYVELSMDKLANQLGNVTVEQLKKFYNDNISMFSSPKTWHIESILLVLPENANEKDTTAVENKMKGIEANAKSGVSFDKLSDINVISYDITRDKMSKEIYNLVENLQPGQVSSPFRTKEGFNIWKIVSVDDGVMLPFDKVRDKVSKAFVNQKLMQSFSEKMDKLSELAYTNPDSLSVVAKSMGLDVQATEPFTRKGGTSQFTKNPKIIKTAFSDLVLVQNYNSNPIEISQGSIAVVRIKQHFPSKARPLQELYYSIENRMRLNAAQKMAQSLGNEILTAFKIQHNRDAISKKYGLVWINLLGLTRDDTRLPQEVVDTAFSVPQNKNVDCAAWPLLGVELKKGGGYAVVGINKVIDGDVTQITAEKRNSLYDSLEMRIGEYECSLIISDWMRRAKIKILQN